MSDATRGVPASDRVVAVRIAGLLRVVEHRYGLVIPDVLAKPLVARQSVARAMDAFEKRRAVRRIGLDRERMGQFAAWQAAKDMIAEGAADDVSADILQKDFEAVYGTLAEVSEAQSDAGGELETQIASLARNLEDAGRRYRVFIRKLQRLRDRRRREVLALGLEDVTQDDLLKALDEYFLDVLVRANETAFAGPGIAERRVTLAKRQRGPVKSRSRRRTTFP